MRLLLYRNRILGENYDETRPKLEDELTPTCESPTNIVNDV